MARKTKPSVAGFGTRPVGKRMERRQRLKRTLRHLIHLAISQGDTLTADLFRHHQTRITEALQECNPDLTDYDIPRAGVEQGSPTILARGCAETGNCFEQLSFDFAVSNLDGSIE